MAAEREPVVLTAEMAREWVDHGEPLPERFIAALRAIASGQCVVIPVERLNKLAMDRATVRGEALDDLLEGRVVVPAGGGGGEREALERIAAYDVPDAHEMIRIARAALRTAPPAEPTTEKPR